MPRAIIYTGLILAALTFIPLAFIAKARVTDSKQPRLQIVPDMDQQPKFKAQASNHFFADGRAMRPPVPGSVARGELQADERFSSGQSGSEWVEVSPVPVTEAHLRRGQERYDIYCAACHGLTGSGDGMVSHRADQLQEGTWIPPTGLTSNVVIERPDGHIYNTISHGLRTMPAYGSQSPPADRWAIVAYVRALQRRINASLEDVPPEVRPSLRQ